MIPKVSERELKVFRQRAIRELDLPPDADDSEIRKAFLESLGRDDLKPVSVQLYRSLRMLERVPQSITCQCIVEPFAEDLDKKEGKEVDEFCKSFFKIQPSERNQRWQELSNSLRETSPHRLRLRQLAKGLSVDLRTLTNASFEARKVAERVLHLFCMPIFDRPAYRRQVIEDHAIVLDLFLKGAEELRIRHPDVLGLDVRFAELIGVDGVKLTKLKYQARINSRNPSSGNVPEQPLNTEQQPVNTEPPSQGWRRILAPWIVVAFVVAVLIPILSEWNARRIVQQGSSQQMTYGGGGYSGVPAQSGNSMSSLPNPSGVPVLPPHLQHLQQQNQANRNAMNRNLPNPGVPLPGVNPRSYTPPVPNRPSVQRGFGGAPAPRYPAPTSPRPAGGFSPGGNFGGPRR